MNEKKGFFNKQFNILSLLYHGKWSDGQKKKLTIFRDFFNTFFPTSLVTFNLLILLLEASLKFIYLKERAE